MSIEIRKDDGSVVDLETLGRDDLLALIQHWKSQASAQAELLRRIEKSLKDAFAVDHPHDYQTLLKMARAVYGNDSKDWVSPEDAKDCPILSEAFLYAIVGKDAARSVLGNLESALAEITGRYSNRDRYERIKQELESAANHLNSTLTTDNSLPDSVRKAVTHAMDALDWAYEEWDTEPNARLRLRQTRRRR